MHLSVKARTVLTYLLCGIGIMLALHLISQWQLFRLDHPSDYTVFALERFNADAESSIPTWYSQSLLLGAAGLLFFIGRTYRSTPTGRDSRYWKVLGVIFVYVSLDEGSTIHELAIEPTRSLLGIEGGFLFFAWIVPLAGLLLLAILFFYRFWRRLPSRTRALFALSLGLFLTGAVIMEMLAGNFISGTTDERLYRLLFVTLEEGLEMLGTSLFIYSLLDYLASLPADRIPAVSFRH